MTGLDLYAMLVENQRAARRYRDRIRELEVEVERLRALLEPLTRTQPIAECYPDNRACWCVYCEVDSTQWPNGFPHTNDCPWWLAKEGLG